MLYCVFPLVEIDQSGQSFNDFLSIEIPFDHIQIWVYFEKLNIFECIPSAIWLDKNSLCIFKSKYILSLATLVMNVVINQGWKNSKNFVF